MHHATFHLQLGTLPDWLAAGATVLAVVFAARAAHWARKSGQAARELADRATDQVNVAKQQLAESGAQTEIARSDAERAREDDRRTHDLGLRSRFDLLAPVVLARAEWDHSARTFEWRADQREWCPVDTEQEISPDELRFYRFTIPIEFICKGPNPAQIHITNSAHYRLIHLRQGAPIVLLPGGSQRVTWQYTIRSDYIHTHLSGPGSLDYDFLTLEYDVLDMASSTRDSWRLIADLRAFGTDGSRLIVKPSVVHPWTETWAFPSGERRYERL